MRRGGNMPFKINKSLKKRIRDSLLSQLNESSKSKEYFENMIDDYMYLWDLKEKLQFDILENGIRIETTNGNGIKVLKSNESVQNLGKVTSSMSKVLSDLGLFEPSVKKTEKVNNGYL